MEFRLYFALSFAMFMEFAIWGAWAPVLAARLLGPLKMTGKQTGWIYATLPLACIVSPFIAGQLADKYVNTETILAVAHIIGGVLIFLAAKQTKFKNLLGLMLAFSLCYAGTLPLVSGMMFSQLAQNKLDASVHSPKIFLWAPVAWALVGYFLTGWRRKFKTGEQGRDCLYLAAILAVIMGIGCLFMPDTPPAKVGTPIADALAMLRQPNFLLFIIISMVVAGLMQFYFLGTAQFMQDMGIPARNVPASMAIAQAVQAVATFFALGYLTTKIGFKWTLVVGAGFWFVMYVVYVRGKPRWLVVISQSLHGLAYVFFIIAGQMLANELGPEGSVSSTQALIMAAQTGLGLFLGTHFAGIVMDRFRKQEKFQWSKIFMVPGAVALACILIFAIFFNS